MLHTQIPYHLDNQLIKLFVPDGKVSVFVVVGADAQDNSKIHAHQRHNEKTPPLRASDWLQFTCS